TRICPSTSSRFCPSSGVSSKSSSVAGRGVIAMSALPAKKTTTGTNGAGDGPFGGDALASVVFGLEAIETLVDRIEVTVGLVELRVHLLAKRSDESLQVRQEDLTVELRQDRDEV